MCPAVYYTLPEGLLKNYGSVKFTVTHCSDAL